MANIMANIQKRLNEALVEAKKKLKTASFTEAPLMVKSD